MRITAHEIPILDRVYMAVSLFKDFQQCGEPKSCTRVRTTTLTYVKPQIANCMRLARTGRLGVEAVASLWEEHKPRGLWGPPGDRLRVDNYSNGER
jgi:hypothetical protein